MTVAEFTLKVDYRAMPPERKLALLEEMGFTRTRAEHQISCTSIQGSGLICTCLAPPSKWLAPADVRKHLHETHDERAEYTARRSAWEDDGDETGEKPERWAL